ncbi:MAG: DUF4238 domain-containing protein [Eggerthellaceae bacterium]|nr:DUF4238 domain-containing protein [Eggerthellaceae bacterium]
MTTKKQHFVPRFYLRHFTNTDGKLQVYRQGADAYFPTAPENICAENYLYEVRRLGFGEQDGNPERLHNYIENQLAGSESRLAQLYEQLIHCCEKHDFETDEYHEGRLTACVLAANLIVRHPHFLESDRLGASELTKTFLATNAITDREQWMLEQIGIGDDLDMVSEIAIMQTLLLSGHPDVPFNRIYNAFADKRMTVIQAPVGMGFITTSMPLVLIGIDEDAYDFQVAYMPLSSKHAALFSTDEHVVEFGRASLDEVIQFNVALLTNGFWDMAMSHAKGALEIPVRRWKELGEAQ